MSNIAQTLAASRAELFQILESSEPGRYADPAIAQKYVNTHSPRYQHDITEVSSRLEPGAKILDLGSAPFCTSHTYHALGFEVTAADFQPDYWLDPDRLPYKITQVNCDGVALPFEEGTFSAVVFTEIFEHLHVNLNFTMKEILRVLAPNGFVYLTTPNLNGLRNMVRMIRRGKLVGNIYDAWRGAETGTYLGHVREYTAGEIEEYLPKCGYDQVNVRTKNVYEKHWFETRFWKAVTYPFPKSRETIVAIARRAA